MNLQNIMNEHLQKVNSSQRSAIEAHDGPTLVSAGAGTGKTRVLTMRYAYLVSHRNVSPHEILAVTFTNKAAQEMRTRLQDYGFASMNLWIGTFHGLILRILRKHSEHIQRTSSFAVLDFSDQSSIMHKILKKVEGRKNDTPKSLLHCISQWKQKMWMAKDVPHTYDSIQRKAYELYEEHLQQVNALDFDDLLMLCVRLFEQHPEILSFYHHQFPHILVDEYQDINMVQYKWLHALAQGAKSLFCVGDDDQSIYGWRGADVHTMMRFSQDFPKAHIIFLEHNYRSTPHILSAASGLIACNSARYGKILRTHETQGEKVMVQGLWDSGEEAAFIGQKIHAHAKEGEPFSSMAVLVRTGSQTREFEERFMMQKIPYRLVGNMRFYERQEVRDFLGYMRLVHSSTDNVAFERVINVPKRGIGAVALQRLYDIAQEHGCFLEAAAEILCQGMKEGAVKTALEGFLLSVKTWREDVKNMPLSHVAEKVLEESGYREFWKSQGSIADPRLENIQELVKSMGEFSSLEEFLEHVSLLIEVGSSSHHDSVSLMTLHAAKGLEFDTVFLGGWEENIFPHIRSMEFGAKGIEEERRLAYVGLTRAKKRSIITFSWNRRMHQGWVSSGPSCFIKELPAEDTVVALHRAATGSSKFSPIASPSARMGDRVYHQIFGHGTVQSYEGQTVSVFFDTQGTKRVVARFLEKI